jgi:N-dimethylarginine dimethylaminohydrolase
MTYATAGAHFVTYTFNENANAAWGLFAVCARMGTEERAGETSFITTAFLPATSSVSC